MDAKQVRKKLKASAKRLTLYKQQLFARHDNEPLKSPPAFLLNTVIMDLERMADELKVSKKSGTVV